MSLHRSNGSASPGLASPGHGLARWRWLAWLGPTIVVVACGDPDAEAWNARRYDEDRDCLERGTVADVVEPGRRDPCEERPRCWLSPDEELYLANVCHAPDGYDELEPESEPVCARAIELWNLGDEGRCP